MSIPSASLQLRVECEDLEVIMMRAVALGGAPGLDSRSSARCSPPGQPGRRPAGIVPSEAFRQAGRVAGDAGQDPMDPRLLDRGIGVVDDQGQLDRPRRRGRPGQGRRDVLAVLGVADRDRVAFLEGGAATASGSSRSLPRGLRRIVTANLGPRTRDSPARAVRITMSWRNADRLIQTTGHPCRSAAAGIAVGDARDRPARPAPRREPGQAARPRPVVTAASASGKFDEA